WVIDRAAVAIRRHREAIFDEGQVPTDKDHINDRHLFVAKMPIPGARHEYVRTDEQYDRRQIRKQKWHGFPLAEPNQAGPGVTTAPKRRSSPVSPDRHSPSITPRGFCLMLCSPPRGPDGLRLGIAYFSCQKTNDRLAKSAARARGGRECYNAQRFSGFSFRNFAVCVFC